MFLLVGPRCVCITHMHAYERADLHFAFGFTLLHSIIARNWWQPNRHCTDKGNKDFLQAMSTMHFWRETLNVKSMYLPENSTK